MRDIKFRVWSTKENKWMFGYEYPNLGGFSLVGEIILCGEFGKYQLDRYFNDFAIMQYTGLKDHNGKEIYEGDIVLYKYHDKFEDGGYAHIRGVVIFENGAFWVKERSFNYEKHNEKPYLLYEWLFDKTEVIGNIYETKEK